ncbi:MAG: hypothetical protein Pg6B_01190 [Candidatus Azobacteroides pseudotrichonymphae]|jgi:propionyl-CoA carboxylase beta chain|nr:MAG: hypothetical protein Pg6B_01190 [Candidatus Azobacteroides pseudotrichonymphae]
MIYEELCQLLGNKNKFKKISKEAERIQKQYKSLSEDAHGFPSGKVQEYNGIVRHVIKILYAHSEVTISKIIFITRKVYDRCDYIVISSKETGIGIDINLAYSTAEFTVIEEEGAVNILYRRTDKETKRKAIDKYCKNFANPYPHKSEELECTNEIILPNHTRIKLIQVIREKWKKTKSNQILLKKHVKSHYKMYESYV